MWARSPLVNAAANRLDPRPLMSYSRRQVTLRTRSTWLMLLGLWGCFHAPQITDDNEVVAQSKIRPLDVDTLVAERVGQEALEKVGFDRIVKLAEQAGFVAYKSNVTIQLTSYGSVGSAGFVLVFSRYAAAAGVTSQADSPLPGPADIAAVGIVVIGLVDAGLLDGSLLNAMDAWLFAKGKTGDEETQGRTTNESRGRGANRADGRMVDDAARHAGIADRSGFGKFIEAEKRATGRSGADNFTWDELRDLADQFISHGGR